MIPFNHQVESQFNFFKKNNINMDFPCFYDDLIFLSIEKLSPHILNNYACFVKQKKYDLKYLKHAKKVINMVVKSLHNELKKTGRKGACVDMSVALSRILEKEGIWNYLVSGSLTMSFLRESGNQKNIFGQLIKVDLLLLMPG